MPQLTPQDVDSPHAAALSHALFAAALVGVVGFILSYGPWPWELDLVEDLPIVALLLLFGGGAAFEAFRAVRALVRARRFGAATLELDSTAPLRLGARLSGRVRTARPLHPTGPIRLVLTCVDTHEFTDHRDNGGQDHRANAGYETHDFVVWERAIEVEAGGLDTTRGIPFAFGLPTSLGHGPETSVAAGRSSVSAVMIPGFQRITTHNAPPVARRWALDVSAPMPGTDFAASFVLAVERR